MQKLYSFNSELNKVTGVQKVLLDIHRAVKDTYDAKIVGTMSYGQINPNHGITESEYLRFKNPFMFYNSIVIVHERKFLMMFWLLNHLLFQRIKLVYVHHNVLYGQRKLTLMPQTVVAISDSGIQNLTEYFRIPLKNIHKIHNCVTDIHPQPRKFLKKETVTLLYPARVNNVKRQIEIYHHLKDKLDHRIRIQFAGEGPYYTELKKAVENDERFVCLGFRSDIVDLLQQCDYMMLFSSQEGLPITLIEAAMCATPIICNDVGGNCEIALNGTNAFVVNDWNELVQCLNSLPKVAEENYLRMAKCSRKIYKENFTFDRFKDNYLRLLSDLN